MSHAPGNRAYWNSIAEEYVEPGRRNWEAEEPSWGIWDISESVVGALPDVDGLDVIELGCGTAYWSAWLARRGARPVGIDISERQLATARELQAEHGLEFPLMLGNAEKVPLPDASFDLAFSEYGASIWCDPYVWIPEAARLLRPGGRLIFLTNGLLAMLCSPDDEDAPLEDRLVRDQFGLFRLGWGDGTTEFHLPHGQLIRVLRDSGFEVERLYELQVPQDAPPTRFKWAPKDWCRRWPIEEIWRARKHAGMLDNQRG
jgi:SAM-dependent methyltransferase